MTVNEQKSNGVEAGANNSKAISTAYMGEGATTYDQNRFVSKNGKLFHELELSQLCFADQKLNENAKILEVGCGTARFSQYLAQKGFDVTASDPSEDMLEIARNKCSSIENIEFKFAEGAALPFDSNSFDMVFAIRVINSIENEEYAKKTINEMIRVAKNEGIIVVEFANKSRPFAKINSSTRLSFKEIKEIAKENGCEVIRESGVLIFSQTLLNIIPSFLLPLWKGIETVSAKLLWRLASRGYIYIKKHE